MELEKRVNKKANKHLFEGKTYISSKYGVFKIVEYLGTSQVRVLFDNGYTTTTTLNSILKDRVKNPTYPVLQGVGYIGVGKYNSKTHKKLYKRWSSMIDRCYKSILQEKHPTYKDVTVCEEWHNFQNFAKWMEDNYRPETMQGWELDKDLLSNFTPTYSPETCCFIPSSLNSLLGFIYSNVVITEIKGKYYINIMVNKVRKVIKNNTLKEALEIYVNKRTEQSNIILNKHRDKLPIKIIKRFENLILEIEVNIKYSLIQKLNHRQKFKI